MVAPWVCEVERPRRRHRNPLFAQPLANGLLVIDDQTEVPRPIGRLRAAGGKRDELIAHVDERHPGPSPAAQLELEEAPVPGERLVDVPDLEGDMIDANQACHRSSAP